MFSNKITNKNNKLYLKISFDEKILKLAKILNENNASLYLVGGKIRDFLLNIPSDDYDFCITGIDEKKLLNIFSYAKLIKKDFPVFKYNNYQFALARKEEKISHGHTGFKINSNEKITILEDLKRRDITINAICVNVITKEIIDPFNGLNDLNNKLIKHISNSFVEDPLRVYRVARFSTLLDFKICNTTLTLMKKIKKELYYLTSKQVYYELNKSLASSTPSKFFKILKKINVLDVHFKEIYNLDEVFFNHTMILLDKLSKIINDKSVKFAVLTHNFGKTLIDKNNLNNKKNGILSINCLCNRLKVPNNWRKKAIEVYNYYINSEKYINTNISQLIKFITEISKTSIGLNNLNIIYNCDNNLNKYTINFAKIGIDLFKNVNGNLLINENITPDIVGISNFKEILYKNQITWLEENLINYK